MPPPPKPEKAPSIPIGKRGCPGNFEEVAFRSVLAEFGGTLTYSNEQSVAEKLAVAIRAIWNWHKLLQTKPS